MTRAKKLPPGRDKISRGCAVLFFAPFALLGTIFFHMLFAQPLYNLIDSRSWAPATCTILTSEVTTSTDSDGSDTYRVAMTYSYDFAGRALQGDRYDFSDISSSGYASKAEISALHPPGAQVPCWVDPEAPEHSVIHRDPGLWILIGLLPVLFMVVGFGGMYFVAVRKSGGESRKARKLSAPPEEHSIQALSSVKTAASTSTGGLLLEPTSTPKGQFVFFTLFALVWNGFLVVMFWNRAELDGCAKLFMIPFVLAGIGVAAAAVHRFLALFNPNPLLELDTGRPVLGGVHGLAWKLDGKANRLRALTLHLVGRESATYRVGTDSRTDTAVFHRVRLLEHSLEHGGAARFPAQGTLEVSIPADGVPSFDAPNNKIEWIVEVRGDIPRWPDISYDFRLPVGPPSASLASPRRDAERVDSRSQIASGNEGGHEHEGELHLELDGDRFEPGDTVRGRVSWNRGMERPKEVLISLLRHTAGKGTEDIEVMAQEVVEQPAPLGDRHFSFVLPETPWSFSGSLISLVWAVEASLDGHGDVDRIEIVSAPGGEEVVLPEPVLPESADEDA